MSLRELRAGPAPVRTQFYVSRARGEAIRTISVRPFALWSLAALFALSLLWAGAATVFLAFHDDMLGALVARQADLQYAYEDRLADARAELDRVAGRQLLDQSSFEGKLHDLLSRQARLEQRSAIVAALAEQMTRSLAVAGPRVPLAAVAKPPSLPALSAITAASLLGPSGHGRRDDRLAHPPPASPPPKRDRPDRSLFTISLPPHRQDRRRRSKKTPARIFSPPPTIPNLGRRRALVCSRSRSTVSNAASRGRSAPSTRTRAPPQRGSSRW